MIPILQFNELSPEDILNRDIRQDDQGGLALSDRAQLRCFFFRL